MATLLFVLSAALSGPSFAIPDYASVTELTQPTAHERAGPTKSPYGNPHLMLAGEVYCYAGSVVDPDTGVQTERFVICPGNGIEQNLDLA